MKKLLLSYLIISSPLVYADGRGEISFSYHRYTKEKSNQINDLSFASFEVEDTGEILGGEYKLGIIGKANSKDRENSYLNVNDLYYSYYGTMGFRFDIGYKIYNWSKMESFHPADVANARLLDSDIENFDKKGELSLVIQNESDFGNIKLYAFPMFEESFFPSADSRIADGAKPKKVIRVSGSEYTEDRQVWQFGISYSKQIGDFDFMAFALNHVDRNRPIVGYKDYTVVTSTVIVPSGDLSAYYFDVLDLGIASTYFLGEHIIKFEMLSSKFDTVDGQNFLTGAGLRRPIDYTTAAIGHEYSHTWDIGWDSTFFTEYQRVFEADQQTRQEISVFQSDLFIGHRLTFNDAYSKELLLGVFLDIERKGEWLINIGYDQRLNDFWK
ncbi:hypothetical protein, partial [Bacteriovorax sp. DB6_IX]|uniref:hypothetical protein n=1 Tax=Bacteriovorax sp. DB6_IX TaxID=1353530 RepID=UPI00038A1CC0